MQPRISEDDPRYKWTRNTGNLDGAQVTVPESLWAILELMRAEVYPFGSSQCLLVRLRHEKRRKHYDSTIPYTAVDHVEYWQVVLNELLQMMARDQQ